ncbi:uncharacterized protein AC631_04755 [Debaryomyces fabryi]|uniref:RRM domain-containing protein n=1 Tax=Debaryomyces fabryi TaxID=58627 RepID=A0A0V1PTA6_9ASCO|nr:uncharacterized protein AC631_04755 [Debaryomyces fabryi]KRZ99469.1 hypothetical protein AC631_04755 [Debaryomyces fabryi]CUM50873.1 unnamed protein product [Debaryomyces fabryi]
MLDFPDAPPLPSVVAKDPDILKTVDKRLSYDKGSSQWLFEVNKDNTSTEYYYNFILERWIPKTENEDSDRKRSHEDDEDTIQEEEEENKLAIRNLKKQKLKEMKEQMNKSKTDGNMNKSGFENTGIYISQLPQDITKDELKETFSKYGLISEDYKTGEPRIKIYHNDDKRDALIIYHGKESVSLAIEMLDDSFIRPPSGKEQEKIKVQPAEFKKPDSDNTNDKKKTLTYEEKKLLNKKKEMMKKKLSSWDDDEAAVQGEELDKTNNIKKRIWDKIVVIEKMFRVEEFKSDPLLEMDLKEDIQEECNKLKIGNDVTKITIYDLSGIITVKFNNSDLSLKCIESFSGRYYDGLTLKAYLYQGEKFQKTSPEKDNEDERLDSFGNWLEKK